MQVSVVCCDMPCHDEDMILFNEFWDTYQPKRALAAKSLSPKGVARAFKMSQATLSYRSSPTSCTSSPTPSTAHGPKIGSSPVICAWPPRNTSLGGTNARSLRASTRSSSTDIRSVKITTSKPVQDWPHEIFVELPDGLRMDGLNTRLLHARDHAHSTRGC